MDTSRLRFGETIAAVSGLVLLISLFLAWYSFGVGGAAAAAGLDVSADANAWQSFSLIDILLFLTAIVAIGLAILTMTQRSVALPVAASVIVTALGALATLLILYRLINAPGPGDNSLVDVDPKFGLFLGLLSAAGIALGGFLSMREEGTSLGEAARGARGGDGHPPAQPAPGGQPGTPASGASAPTETPGGTGAPGGTGTPGGTGSPGGPPPSAPPPGGTPPG